MLTLIGGTIAYSLLGLSVVQIAQTGRRGVNKPKFNDLAMAFVFVIWPIALVAAAIAAAAADSRRT